MGNYGAASQSDAISVCAAQRLGKDFGQQMAEHCVGCSMAPLNYLWKSINTK